MNYYAGPRDYVENLLSPWRTPRRSPSHTQKQNLNMSWQTRTSRCEFRAQKTATELATRESESVHGTRNERVESVTTCWGSVSASFLRNPGVRRNSSYAKRVFFLIYIEIFIHSNIASWFVMKWWLRYNNPPIQNYSDMTLLSSILGTKSLLSYDRVCLAETAGVPTITK